jgi:hypothetical protein
MTNDAKKSSRTVSQTWSRETAEEKPGPTQSGLWRTAGHRARQVRSERLGYGIKFHNAGYRALAYIYIYISSYDFSGLRLRSWSLRFCASILLLAFLSVHCVSLHRRFHKRRRISTLKTKNHFCVYLLDIFVFTSLTTTYHWVWIVNSRKIARWWQNWRFQVSLQRKNISSTYLVSITSLPEDEKTSKHGGGVRYNAI